MKKICMMHDFYEKSSAYPIRAQSGYHGIITFFFFFLTIALKMQVGRMTNRADDRRFYYPSRRSTS